MSKNDEFEIGDIEKVKVNGLNMYKLGHELCLTKGDAIKRVNELSNNWNAKNISFDSGCDVIKMICDGKVLHGIRLG